MAIVFKNKKVKETLEERIKRLRSNMLVHSYLYYQLNTQVIDDDRWQSMANRLATLQDKNGHKFEFYDDVFKDWTGDTGMHLPVDDWVKSKADQLVKGL